MPAAGPEQQIQHALESLLRLSASRRVHASQSAAAGLTISQPAYTLLRQAALDGPLAMGDLARRSHMDPGAAARQVGQLERAGLLERFASDADRRVSLVRLTSEGKAMHQRLARVRNRHLADTLSGWSARDRATFARLLTRFVDEMRARGFESPDQAE